MCSNVQFVWLLIKNLIALLFIHFFKINIPSVLSEDAPVSLAFTRTIGRAHYSVFQVCWCVLLGYSNRVSSPVRMHTGFWPGFDNCSNLFRLKQTYQGFRLPQASCSFPVEYEDLCLLWSQVLPDRLCRFHHTFCFRKCIPGMLVCPGIFSSLPFSLKQLTSCLSI